MSSSKPIEPIMVFCNAPDRACAELLAQKLMERRLAACVNILAPCKSVYRWQGQQECAEEYPLLIKTTRPSYAALEATIREFHPYEVPEITFVPITGGLPAYLAWVDDETGAP